MTLLKGVLSFFQGRWTEIASQSVAYDLRNALHHKLSALSFSYHDRAQTGQLLSRAVQDVERIRFLTGRATLRLVEGATLLLGTTSFLVHYMREARMYTLLMSLAVFSMWAYLHWLRRPTMTRLIVYSVTVAALPYIHYCGPLVTLSQGDVGNAREVSGLRLLDGHGILPVEGFVLNFSTNLHTL